MSVRKSDLTPANGANVVTESYVPAEKAAVQPQAAPRQKWDVFARNELPFKQTVAQMPDSGMAKSVFKDYGLPNQTSVSGAPATAVELSAHELAAANPQGMDRLLADVRAQGSREGELDLRSLSDEAFFSGFARLMKDVDENVG